MNVAYTVCFINKTLLIKAASVKHLPNSVLSLPKQDKCLPISPCYNDAGDRPVLSSII